MENGGCQSVNPSRIPHPGWVSKWADWDGCQWPQPHCSDLASFHAIDSASPFALEHAGTSPPSTRMLRDAQRSPKRLRTRGWG